MLTITVAEADGETVGDEVNEGETEGETTDGIGEQEQGHMQMLGDGEDTKVADGDGVADTEVDGETQRLKLGWTAIASSMQPINVSVLKKLVVVFVITVLVTRAWVWLQVER